MGMTINGFELSRKWQGQWITAPHMPQKNACMLLRREFTIEEQGPATLFITADTRYRVYVNGTKAGWGPPPSQPYHTYYDALEIGEFLVPGKNCVAMEVYHTGDAPHGRPGLLAEVVMNGVCPVASDGSWRTALGTAWSSRTFHFRMNRLGPYQERFDARTYPCGWQECGFDAGEWSPADVLGPPPTTQPWTLLLPRNIPHMKERSQLASSIARLEECIDLENRVRSEDLSISLSAVGRPLKRATASNTEALLETEGVATLQCSTDHEDHVFDGRYDPCITLDFGRVITAYADLDVDGPAGAVIEIGYTERLVDGHFNNAIECCFADALILREGRQSFRPWAWRSFRYLKLRVKRCDQPLHIHAARAVEVNYPFHGDGAFESPDPLLQGSYDISRRTLGLCSIESIMDTPFREQAQWLGDVAAVTIGGLYACHGETALPGKFLRQAAANQRSTGFIANISNQEDNGWPHDIVDYSLWWVMALWNHYLYTGEEHWVHHLYPEACRTMRAIAHYRNDAGLLENVAHWVFVDWADVDKRGASAALNGIYAGALEAMAKLASVKGDHYAREQCEAFLAQLKTSFAPTFQQTGDPLLADATRDGCLSKKHSEHTNMAAIRWGLVDETEATAIVEQLFGPGRPAGVTEAQPFFMVVVLDGLYRIGRMDLALDLIRERYGKRMVERGLSSTSEEWGINGSWRSGSYAGFQRTLSHAWSACPAEFLTKRLAGIEIGEPGCTQIRVTPYCEGPDFRSVFPTPHGNVRVSVEKGKATVSADEGIQLQHG